MTPHILHKTTFHTTLFPILEKTGKMRCKRKMRKPYKVKEERGWRRQGVPTQKRDWQNS